MSESDVSRIRDEELLRRMWQQSEDFSKKKEIRAHMYRLREERLRDLYSPEPAADKGSAFSSSRGHTRSFADQTFQSMKSKEVRDAGSPPKEFSYRGQDAAGWSSEEQRHHISSATSAEQRYQKSSHATATFQERTDAVDRERLECSSGTETVERVDVGQGELISRKVEHPSENVKVVVEKRTLPDGTEITTTEREFRTPILQRSVKEHHAQQTTTESGAVTSSSNFNKSTMKTSQDSTNQQIYSAPEVSSHLDTENIKTVDISTDDGALSSQDTSKIRNDNFVALSQRKVKNISNEKDTVLEKRDTRVETTLETAAKHETDHLDRYQTTYQSDYTDKKVSQDLSPTHQAWASTLRGDSPSRTSHSSNSTLRRSTSPDKPLNQSRSRTGSPSKYDSYTSFDRISTTSDVINSNSASSHYRKSMSPSRASKSPDRKFNNRRQHSASPDKTPSSKMYSEYFSGNHESNVDYQKTSTRHENSRSSNSPEKQDPGYLKPTFSSTNHSHKKYDEVSESEHNTRSESEHNTRSESEHNTRSEYSPEKKVRSESPETYSTTTHDKTTKKTYRDESYDDVDNITVTEYSTSDKESNKVFRKSSSPTRTSPAKDSSTRLVSSLRQNSPSRRSPSPPKGPVTFESDLKNVTNVHNITKTVNRNTSPDPKQPLRDSSPSKYATYTKKSDVDKNSPRQSISPVKMSIGNSTHTNVNEFIKKEKSMEEHNRNIKVDRSRQLVTPSTSPTRKPKVEKESSTGQSSPTTSVSEIIYFSSPRQSENRNIITDAEDTISRITERSPSPTKIPQHRNKVSSPEKHIPTTKDNLPRKSSLKKTSFNYTTQQTLEYSTAAQDIDDTALTEHKVVKKDRPDKDITTNEIPKRKEKPPLQRRETYEDRCRKILGMTESDTGEKITVNNDAKDNITTTMTSLLKNRSHSNSPRNSPTKEPSPQEIKNDNKYAQTNNDFITSEKQSLSKGFNTDDVIVKKTKSSSRNCSPTKLRDIISDESNYVTESHKTQTTNNVITTNDEQQHTLQSFGSDIKTDTRRTPSPCKKPTNVISDTKQFISKEKQREILSKVQNSLRKLSPTRDNKSKTINKVEELSSDNTITSRKEISAHDVISNSKTVVNGKTDKISSKPCSRNVSPDKKSTHVPAKKNAITSPKIQKVQKISNVEKIVESSKKISDTKLFTNQSVSNSLMSDLKVDKNEKDLNKSTKILNNQNINNSYKNSKTTQVGNKPINKTNILKESVKKVPRTSSDNSIKYKKSTLRMSSKPEIHVNDISHNKSASKLKVNEKMSHRSSSKDTIKITNKPKSATALNTVTDTDDDIIIDIQQAKSSRENSPDRICPTPVFEDTGKPRLPDEVSEPDDAILRRMHHTIHETESIVDDIVEISEDDELFVKKRDINKSSETDKISKFANNERRVHSDFVDENLKSDECMLTVSEKVSKFTNIKDDAKVSNRYSIENEYDSLSKYQDDYTKLSVNDKAHLFVENAENEHDVKVSKYIQNSTELNVSDKVNKFIKTAEKFLNEAHLQDSFGKDKVNEKPKQESDKHSHDMSKTEKSEDTLGTFAKETVSSHAKLKKYVSPNLKTPERVPVPKITTLRSNEAIKKAKALFENIASSTKLEEKTSAKLADIGVNKRSAERTSDSVKVNTQDNEESELITESLEKSNLSTSRFSSTTSRQSPVEPTTTRTRSPRRHVDVQHEHDVHKQETNNIDDVYEVSTRRGSGKFGVELKRTGQEKTSTERRRPSDDLRQPCIEDIYNVELLEQMLEKVVGYEQRRRIRAQIRVAKKKMDTTTNITTSSRDVNLTEHTTSNKRTYTDKTLASKARSPTRRSSPEKKIRSVSPLKTQTSPNKNRFNEYASAYMKKVGLNSTSESKFDTKRTVTEQTATTTSITVDNKLVTENTERKEPAEVAQDKVARASSPRRSTRIATSPGHEIAPTDKLYRRTPSPQFKRPLRDSPSRTRTDGTQTKSRQVQEDKPAWVTNRTLKKTTSETRASTKKIEIDKKYRAASPSKVVARPTDVITSGYGPGPLDADGRPLFGIKALRNGGGVNYKVKGTVVQEEYHSHNGGEPEGTVSVTTYSNDPDYLDRVLRDQDERPSRIHGLAAITTTKKFGGDSGVTMKQLHNKEEHFHKTKDGSNERKVCVDVEERKGKSEYRNDNTVKEEKSIKRATNTVEEKKVDSRWSQQRKTVRQNSVKSLAEKYTDSVSGSKERHPRPGLVLNTTTRTTRQTAAGQEVLESGTSIEESQTMTREERGEISSGSQRSFLNSEGVKVTGVQDILTRMKNADIVVEAGDSGEEAEARSLLNKFLGATVLMAGMQAYVTDQPAHTTRSQTAQTVSSSVRHGEVDIENCWDEQLLRQLLEQNTDYEQRRRLRARLRALMAEQQACVDAVTDVLESGGAAPGEKAEGAGAENRGESLLEPLLRGLLGGGLLGGLSAAGADVLRDVRRALGRLRDALAPPAAHPDAEKLLALADRLEDALDAADRLDGCKRRPRRRSRAARHTVGVTAGELQRAREVADREELRQDSLAPCQPSPPAPTVPPAPARVPETRLTPPPIARSFIREEPPRKPETSDNPEARDLHRHSIADAEPGRRLEERPARDERAFRRSRSGTEAAADQYVALRSREAPRPPERTPRKPTAPRTWTRSPPPPTDDVPRVPLYKPPPPGYNFAAPPQPEEAPRTTPSRFMRQRARMKRANTIDIPKPAGAYQLDSDAEEEGGARGARPVVPPFQPQTDNDRKFLAFMKKNNENDSAGNKMFGPVNWSSRFGNIKNTFENRDDTSRAPWRASDDHAYRPPRHDFEPRVTKEVQLTTLQSNKENIPRAPWHRDIKPVYEQPPSPTRPPVVKPFAAKPIPMNQFSHAPMSAFKPLKKLPSPAHVWSPPSSCLVSPQPVDNKSVPLYKCTSLTSPKPASVSPVSVAAPWIVGEHDKPKRVLSLAASKFETNGVANIPVAPFTTSYKGRKFTSPEAVQTSRQQYPVRAIPSQNNLAAPELVKKVDYNKRVHDDEINNFPTRIDAQKLQIEFYEKQIRQKKPSELAPRDSAVSVGKPPPPRYTVTNYTPPNVVSTFVPLQQTPDIEKASAHKVDYLPDVVMTELGQPARANPYTASSPGSSGSPHSPRARPLATLHNEEEVSIESSLRRNSSEKSVSRTSTTTKSSKVIESMTRPAPKPVSAFAKFRQLDKQNSTTNPSSPKTPQSPGSPSQPYFKFTEPALACSAITIKERLLQWCRDKTREYENVKLENFSTSWSDGLAFCALVHHFLPNAFDYSKLTADKRRHNFTLAFKVADEKAGIYPLLDVDDMVAMRKPDWKCVFTYVQSIHRRFKDQS